MKMYKFCIFWIIVYFPFTFGYSIKYGSDSSGWSKPFELYQVEYPGSRVTHPVLTVDAYGTVHAFWLELPSSDVSDRSNTTIFHSSLINGQWTTPNDVIIADGGNQISVPGPKR